MLKVLRLGATTLAVALGGFVGQAHCERPTSKLVTAPLISPAEAWQYYNGVPGGLTRTSTAAAISTVPPEIQALARSLGAERVSEAGLAQISAATYAQNVSDYVRNNIATEFRFGLGKGARGALIDQSGTPFDQADLMAALLRQGGVTPVYKVGTVQLSAQQIGAWTGMARTFSTAPDGTQTVSVNARALCQFLADGAIPATFSIGTTTVTSCASLSGDLSAGDSVTIGHIWIEAAGQTFDPSFKRQRFTQGLDLGVATGCGTSCGANTIDAALRSTSGTGPAVTGSFSGKPYFSNVNETAVNAQLTAIATNVETYIKANAPNATIEELVGGHEIDVKSAPSAPAGYVANYSWSGLIPDGFRSSITLSKNGGTVAAFGDELAGQRLLFMNGTLVADSGTLATSACPGNVDRCDVTIGVNHPYAANGGAYGDESLFFNTNGAPYQGENNISTPQFAVIIAWGNSSSSTESHFAALQRTRPAGLIDISTLTTDATWALAINDFATRGATVLKAQSMSGQLIDRITNVETTRHHSIGVVALVWQLSGYKTLSRISIHSTASANSHSADATERATGFEVGTQLAAMLEGGTLQYANDSFESGSAAAYMVLANRNGQKLIDVAPGGLTTSFLSALSGYSSTHKSLLQARAAEGYGFILTENEAAGPFPVTNSSLQVNLTGSYVYRGGNGALNGDDGAQAPLIRMDLKGGSPTLLSEPSQVALRAVNDGPTNAKQKLAASADPATGAVSLTSTDLVTGSGDFPNSLPFQRFYNSASGVYEMQADNWWTYEGPDDASPLHMPNGWTHTYSYTARLGTSVEGALGEQGGLGASALVAGIYSLAKMQAADPFERRVTSLFAAKWMNDQINGNAVIMSEPTSSTVFVRLPSGGYAAPLGSQSRVVVTGARTGPYADGGSLIYQYSAVRLSRTFADGSVMSFEPQESYKYGTTFYDRRVFRPIEWAFPGGMKVKFAYHQETYDSTYKVWILDSVANSLGRKITVLSSPVTLETSLVRFRMWRVSGVKDETNRTVSYGVTGCPNQRAFICDTLSVTGTDTYITKYGYAPDGVSPNPSAATLTRLPYRLRRVYPPSAPSSPIQTVVYDEVLRARSIIDGNQRTTRYFPGAVVGTEIWKRAEVISPRQDVLDTTLAIFDERNNAILTRNALNDDVVNTYDPMGRLVRSELPEHNATEYTYDLRSNLLSTCSIPKERAGWHCDTSQGDIKSSRTYVEGSTVWACANLANCNKVKTETDPRDATTEYDWDADGFLNWVQGPLIGTQQSRTDLDYKTYAIDNGAIKFLWHKTERVADGQPSIVTLYDYNPAKKYALKSAIVDPTGKAITSCFDYDDLGRLTSVTDPRAGVCQ